VQLSVVFVVDQRYCSWRASSSDLEKKHFPPASARKATHLDLRLVHLSKLSNSTSVHDKKLKVGRKYARCIGRSGS